jgi:4-amino-4-deoxy-L-arabinose transferase-like glycosyltransferase
VSWPGIGPMASAALPGRLRPPWVARHNRPAARPLALQPLPLLGALLLFALVVLLDGYRHQLTPDIHVDELIYASAGQNIAAGAGLSVQGQPFFWQPPLQMLVTAPLIALQGFSHIPVIDLALHLRLFNAIMAGFTAMLLFWLGWRWRGWLTGSVMALLFATDPFVIRVARRFYLEPFAGVWVVAALGLLAVSLGRLTPRRRLYVGLLFGLALLSKELVFYALAVPVLLSLRGDLSWRHTLQIAGGSVAVYLLYPLWAVVTGQGKQFLDLKLFQYERLIGVNKISGVTRPGGVSLTQTLVTNAADYWTSYLLIALAVPATVYLWRRRDRFSRFLSSWSAVTILFIAGLGAFGTLNDQFFYYLMLSTTAVVADAAVLVLAGRFRRLAACLRLRRWTALALRADAALMAILLAVLIARPAIGTWTLRFGQQVDDGFPALAAVIPKLVPLGAGIDVPGASLEILHFAYPNGEHPLAFDSNTATIQAKGIHWVVLASKDVQQKLYPQAFYDAVLAHGIERWSVDEHTFFHFALYEIPDLAALSSVRTPGEPAAPLVDSLARRT